jgi:hypothetical protein
MIHDMTAPRLAHGRRMHAQHATCSRSVHAGSGAGREGLNYGSLEKTYLVPAYGPESLSGLEVMCIMFAAFKRVPECRDAR